MMYAIVSRGVKSEFHLEKKIVLTMSHLVIWVVM